MPTYTYKCSECGERIEKFSRSFEKEEPPRCPPKGGCPEGIQNGHVFDRVIGKPAIHFKGEGNNTGFHSIDYNDLSNPTSNNQ